MNKKFVTLLSVVVLSGVANGALADEVLGNNNNNIPKDNIGVVVVEAPKETPAPKADPVEQPAPKEDVDLGDKAEKPVEKDNTGVVVEPISHKDETPKPAITEKPEDKKPSAETPATNNDKLVDSDKKDDKNTTTTTTPSEKVDSPKVLADKKKAEDNVGVTEQEAPKPLNVTKDDIKAQPIETNTGYTVVSTNQGKVVVEADKGDFVEKEPYEIGAVKQSDGTIALKDKEGQLKVLPNTGSVGSIFVSILGVIGLVATILGKRKLK